MSNLNLNVTDTSIVVVKDSHFIENLSALFVRKEHSFTNTWGNNSHFQTRESGGERSGSVTVKRLARTTMRQYKLTHAGTEGQQWYAFSWEGRSTIYLHANDHIIVGDLHFTVEMFYNMEVNASV